MAKSPQAFKNDYVSELIAGGVTAPVVGMPEQDFGETSSIRVNLDDGTEMRVNDGNPVKVVGSKHLGIQSRQTHPEYAYPVDITNTIDYDIPWGMSLKRDIKSTLGLPLDQTPANIHLIDRPEDLQPSKVFGNYEEDMAKRKRAILQNGKHGVIEKMTDEDYKYLYTPPKDSALIYRR